MILFTNGCSWTAGGGLGLDRADQNEQRLASTWPHYLGNLLGAEKTVNLSADCGSNSRILRTTFDWIHEQTPEDLSNTVAVIQWTEYSRYEYYTPDDFSNFYENIPDRWAKAKMDCVLSKYEYDRQKVLGRYRSRLSTYTEIEGVYKHVADCNALGALFKSYNIKYYYWHFMGNVVETFPEKFSNYLLNNHKWLDNGGDHWVYDRVNPKTDLHPSFLGNKQLAEIIYNKMREKE